MSTTFDTKCLWENMSCREDNTGPSIQDWWLSFTPCLNDSYQLFEMRNYCGGILTKTVPMTIQLVQNSGYYGAKNLYCKWKARIPASSQLVSFNFTSFVSSSDQFMLESNSNDGKSYFTRIEPKSYFIAADQLLELNIHYLGYNAVTTLPFQITITSTEEGYTNFVGLFISIGVIVLICIICSIFFYRCSKVIIENNRRLQERRALELAALSNNYQPMNRDDEIKIKNKILLESYFKNDLKPVKYTSELNEYNSPKCTICLEAFIPTNDVTKLYCKHLFHFNCLQDWLDKILLDPKCPVCNDQILPKEDEGAPINSNDNSRRDFLFINNNSTNRRNTNAFTERNNQQSNISHLDMNTSNLNQTIVNPVVDRNNYI
jgi:hypothetical protein